MAIIKTNPHEWAEGDWAVWRYDMFPGFLCGAIGPLPKGWKPRPLIEPDTGRVFVGSYQSWFRPRLVVDEATGRALYALQERLHRESAKAHAEAVRLMNEKREAALGALDLSYALVRGADHAS